MNNPTNHIERLNLDLLSMGFPALIFCIFAAAAVAFWYYNDTVPPVTGFKKWALVSLRTTALTLLFIALAEPVMEIITTSEKKSKVAVLIDTSTSMNQNNDSRRKTDTIEIMNKIRASHPDDVQFFGFDNRLYPLITPEPEFEGVGTDILNAVIETKNTEDVSSILIVSDGRWNLGEDPGGSNLPDDISINTVTVGTNGSDDDVAINRIISPSIGRDGELFHVEIRLNSTKEIADAIPVRIEENNRTLAEGTAVFENSKTARTEFEFSLEGTGDHNYSIIIEPENDMYTENNNRFFDVHVMKSSYRVLISADKPSADLAFIRRVLETGTLYKLDVTIDKGTLGALNQPFPDNLSDYDALILLNWGGTAVTSRNTDIIIQWVSSGGGLWIIGSSGLSAGAEDIRSILPLTFAEKTISPEKPFSLRLTETGNSHFITAKESGNEREWSILPPLTSILPVSNVTSAGRILAETVPGAAGKIPLPVIVTGKYGSGKIVVMPVSGIWRWQLMMEGAGKGGGFFRSFVDGNVNWLTSEAESSPLNVKTDRTVYLGGQEINFEARLYDAVFSPVGGAEVTIEIDNNPASKIILSETQPSVYTGTLKSIDSGEHAFLSTAFLDGRLFAESTGSFTVQNFSLEHLDITVNRELMRSIAERNGGINVSPSGIDSVLSRLETQIITERSESKHNIYLNPLMPLLIVLLFTVEWSIRKYRGMI
ncbi:hypothetical protein ACFL50_02655 [Candidatus Latescibacterota bacterium]